MNDLKLYLRYVGISFRSQMQYRASFAMMALGQFVSTALEFVAIVALFDRFGGLQGWTLPEVAVFYGMVNVGFAVSEAAARGFDTFPGIVRTGEFDRILLRPRSTILQVAAREFQLMRVGRLGQGLAVLLWGAAALGAEWTLPRTGLLVFAVAGGACLFAGLFIAQATMAFWTIETLEIMNTVTYGGTETGQYPISIYRPWFRGFFTFVVPLACVTFYPALAILGREGGGAPGWFLWTAPAIGIGFLLLTVRAWRFGVLHYHSTGS